MRNRFQKPDFSLLGKVFVDLAWIIVAFLMFSIGFVSEVKKGNASSACMFAGAALMIIKLLEVQIKNLKR